MKQDKNSVKHACFKPKKQLGQNFLLSKQVLKKILESSSLKETDIVVEIGPGFGALTLPLAQRVKKVIAIEKDSALVLALKEKLPKNVELIQGDILKTKPFLKKYKVVANLPYNIATKVIMDFLESKNPPQLMVVMVQKEVAQRICSCPPQMSKLAVFCQAYSKPTISFYVKKESFYPKPKVDSAVVMFENIRLPKTDLKLFSKIVSAGFVSPRKTLLNNLSKGLNLSKEQTGQWLSTNKISPLARAETLSVSNWLGLVKNNQRGCANI